MSRTYRSIPDPTFAKKASELANNDALIELIKEKLFKPTPILKDILDTGGTYQEATEKMVSWMRAHINDIWFDWDNVRLTNLYSYAGNDTIQVIAGAVDASTGEEMCGAQWVCTFVKDQNTWYVTSIIVEL